MIEIVLGELVFLVVVLSGRRWMQARRRAPRSDGIAFDAATRFRDQNHMPRRTHDGDVGTGPF